MWFLAALFFFLIIHELFTKKQEAILGTIGFENGAAALPEQKKNEPMACIFKRKEENFVNGESKADYIRINATGDADKDGVHVLFGTYPQSEVKDKKTIEILGELTGATPTKTDSGKWVPYGTPWVGPFSSYYMWSIDVSYGDERYRGFYYEYNSSEVTMNYLFPKESKVFAINAHYRPCVAYWFKYEPISWQILKESGKEAFLLSDKILDNQPYCQFRFFGTELLRLYEHNGGVGYNNNYALSDIRAWLNGRFYDTAFDESQKKRILKTKVKNNAKSKNPHDNPTAYSQTENRFACADTEDYIFLLSEQEVTNAEYGFNPYPDQYDAARSKQTTDYTTPQCVCQDPENGYLLKTRWWLRSPSCNDSVARYIDGNTGYDFYCNTISLCGVVPALWIRLK